MNPDQKKRPALEYPAPERVDTVLAEKFLRTGNLAAITTQLDPLGLVQVTEGEIPQTKIKSVRFRGLRSCIQNGVDGGVNTELAPTSNFIRITMIVHRYQVSSRCIFHLVNHGASAP